MTGPLTVLLGVSGLTRSYGAQPLFEGLAFSLFEGDRLGIVGPNGSGKTTLIRILAGLEEPDAGEVTRRRLASIGYAPQDPVFDPRAGVGAILDQAQEGLGLEEGERAARMAVTLGKAGFDDPLQPAGTLSGGMQKRLAIARALIGRPAVLLLDEPTNHLDLEGILWLEELLEGAAPAVIVVSHDRWFLERTVTRMIELNRRYARGLFECAGSYSDFLERREAALAAQEAHREALANRVRREIEWLRRGPKARTRKGAARKREAERMIDELGDLESRAASPAAGIELAGSGRKTKRLLAARGISKRFGERRIFGGLDLVLSPGRRIGVMGANGSGKTTLLKVLAGELDPDEGKIERAPNLATVYFEQSRETLDLDLSLRRALAPDGDLVVYRGRAIHVAAWAERFLFRSAQLDAPCHRLSGGERARILIARTMLRPADLLILDEPTNDLDLETLAVLEDSLLDFPGALLLVTHDRFLLDRVSDSLLALDGRGGAEFFADYDQFAAFRQKADRLEAAARRPKGPPEPAGPPALKPKKLTYLEQREWDGMEQAILEAEENLAAAEARAADPTIVSNASELQVRLAALAEAQSEVNRLYSRWAELEAKRAPLR